jgi:signal transduction histidine kinase
MTIVVSIAVVVLVWLTALVWSFGIEPIDLAREIAPAWAFSVAGLVAWRRRPNNRIGPLMVVIGATLLLWSLRTLSVPALVTFGMWMSLGPGLPSVLLGTLVLAYPSGHIPSRLGRAWVALALVGLLAPQLGLALATPVGFWECGESCPSLLTLWYDERVRVALLNLTVLIFAGLAIALLLLLARRWLKASAPARRVLAPVWLAGAVVAVVVVSVAIVDASVEDSLISRGPVPSLGRFLRGNIPMTVMELVPWIVAVSLLLVPLALLWGFLRAHLGQAAVSNLAIELGRVGNRAPLTESLRRALGDQSLDLVLWSRPAGAYVTTEGLPVSLPDEDSDRAVTRLDGEDGPLAALLHDQVLTERASLVNGVAAVAQLAIENERLHAEVKSQLEEVRASRERIVRAGDEERRRVERNIHDGAQQRLVSLSLALSMAHAKATHVAPDVVQTIMAAETELKEAIGELRELARGIHPAILTEAGLGPALESLADRSPIPVTVQTNLQGRLPPLVEATAYFVVAEALTNVAKHTAASTASLDATVADGWLRLTVADNGGGGADPARGSGLRGLLDRVAALGGRLSIEDDGSGGTRLTAAIPCA